MATGTDDLVIARALRPHLADPLAQRRPGEAGSSSGVNISPGSDDDGWIVPRPITLADGTRIQLFKDGEALHAAYEAIGRAQNRICLEVYIFASDPTGRAFADLLCEKARQGVRVYVLYDAFGSFASDLGMFAQMRRAGVNVRKFHPIRPWDCQYSWRPILRDHRKLLVIDNEIGGLGGLNVGSEYGGSWVGGGSDCCEFWRDNAIGVVGPSARLLLNSFAHSWNYVTWGGRIRRAEVIHNLDEGDFGLLASVPARSSPLTPMLTRLLRGARKSILLTMAYFAPPEDLVNELCRAARRGVRVRLMLPGRCDVRLLIIAARSFYEQLLSAGVEIYERQGVVLHAKSLVIDRHTCVIGSSNLDYRSIEYNLELSAIVRHETFAGQMHDLFEHDVRFADRITLQAWRRRPILDRMVQWAVKRSRYLL